MLYPKSMRILDCVKSSLEYLEKSGIDDPLFDAEMLVFHAAGIDRLQAYTDNPELKRGLSSGIRKLLERRAKGEPVQYIVGHVEFLGLVLRVGPGVLIPRPETELLAMDVIEEAKSLKIALAGKSSPSSQSIRLLDLCTGSGCIALSLAKEFPDFEVYGTDISEKAIRYATENADLNGIGNVTFFRGSLFHPVNEFSPFDLIVSNPPYVRSGDIGHLQREIKDWEPVSALDGGSDGLDFYRNIFAEAGRHLKAKGKILVELGYGQAEAVKNIADDAGLKEITVQKDYAEIERILTAGK